MTDDRLRTPYTLDVDEAVAAIRAMNASRAASAGDWLLHGAFPDLVTSLETNTLAERVILVDGLWGTNLAMERGAADRIIENLVLNKGRLLDLVARLTEDALESKPEEVWRITEQAMPVILEQSSERNSDYRENLSFATKFFHWCTRRHFPIVDKNARARINALQKSVGVRPVIRAYPPDKGKRLGEYRLWIEFYSDLIHGLGLDDRRRLEKGDYDSLPSRYRFSNSLLRILDKYFWWWGG